MNPLKTHFIKCLIVISLGYFFAINQINAQTPVDAIMMPSGVLCVDASYDYSQFNKYWEGTLQRENGNMGILRRHTISPMIDLGVLKWLNVMAAAHYVITNPTAGQLEGAKGFSDFNFWIKTLPLHKQLGPGTFDILLTAGFAVPLTKYVADYPYSIGMGCPEGSLKAILQYELKQGFYIRSHVGYMLRGQTKLQRTYYYTSQGHYTNQVSIPDAIDYSGVVGYFSKDRQYKGEIFVDGIHTIGGFDIRRQDMMFPSNKVYFTRVGGRFDYYPTVTKGLSVHVMGGYVVAGRNTGQAGFIGGGVAFAFKVWNRRTKKQMEKKASVN
jgi:hypothetical protein